MAARFYSEPGVFDAMQETIEEEMVGRSFDSPTADLPSSNSEGVPPDQTVVCRRPSDGDPDRVLRWRRESSGALGCRSSSSHRRTWSIACLRPLTHATDEQLTDRCAIRSTPNIRWMRDAAAAAKCVCDATSTRTSIEDEGTDCRLARPAAGRRSTAASRGPPSVERSQRVSRSDPAMLKLPPSTSKSNCHEHREASRPSSLDRFRSQRQRSLPPSRETLLLPENAIFPTSSRLNASVQL